MVRKQVITLDMYSDEMDVPCNEEDQDDKQNEDDDEREYSTNDWPSRDLVRRRTGFCKTQQNKQTKKNSH